MSLDVAIELTQNIALLTKLEPYHLPEITKLICGSHSLMDLFSDEYKLVCPFYHDNSIDTMMMHFREKDKDGAYYIDHVFPLADDQIIDSFIFGFNRLDKTIRYYSESIKEQIERRGTIQTKIDDNLKETSDIDVAISQYPDDSTDETFKGLSKKKSSLKGNLTKYKKEMDAVIKQFFAENRMKDGFVFVQGFYEDGHFFIHEIGYRLNGGFSFKLVEHLCNYNQIHQLVKYSLTGKMDKEEIAKSDPYLNGKIGMILTATLGKGTIKKIGGVEKAASLPGVIQFYQLKEVGTTLTSNGTTAQVFAYILITADTAEDLKKLIIDIEGLITVEDESGNNLLLPMINPEELRFIENKKNERFKN